MALVFKTPKTAINTTTRDMQNLSADCPPCPEVKLTTADVEYTENGSFTVTPESGFDGLSQVDITVNIPSDVKNQDKFVTPTTSSQTITADSGYSGLGTVSVSAVTSTIDHNITASNIKSGVTILGVTGTVTEGITPTGNINITNTNSTDVTNYATAQVVDANLTAGNIKSGTTILGVQGSYDPQPDLETKSVTYTANDTYTITPTAGKDGMSSVEVTVNVSGSNCPDWSSIGWDCNDVTASGLEADVAYTAQKKAEYEAGTISTFKNDKKLIFAPKINIKTTPLTYTDGVFYNCDSLICTPAFSVSVTSLNHLFDDCNQLNLVSLFDTSNVTSMDYTFQKCTMLRSIPLFNTSNVTSMVGTFYNSGITEIPQLDTHNVTTLQDAFRTCRSLTTFPSLDTSKVTSFWSTFNASTNLDTIRLLNMSSVTSILNTFAGCSGLTTLEGFTNLGKAFVSTDAATSHTLDLSSSKVLTKESIMNVINNLAAPDDTTVTNATLKLSATSYALLDASDIAIATAKNWTVTSA